MKRIINKLLQQQKEKNSQQRVKSLNEGFYVKERSGKIWLLHDGVAFKVVPPETTSTEIIALLQEARTAASQFDNNSNN